MSGSKSQAGGAPPSSSTADPSMEDILASIRRILSEEDLPAATAPAVAKAPEPAPPEEQSAPDILILDESMLVDDAPRGDSAEPEVPPRAPVIARSPLPPPPPIVIPSEAVEEPQMAEADLPEAALDPVVAETAVWTTVEPEPAIAEAEREPSPAEPPPVFAEAEPQREPVRTETPMPSVAFPALTPSAAEKLEPSANELGLMFSAATSPIGPRLPATPVLVPVPLSGQIPPMPLIRPPAAVRDAATRITPKPAPPPEIEPAPITPTETTPQSESSPMSASMSATAGLASPETATAAAGSVTNLVRALTSDRNPQVHSGGPTIADLVREEIRPMLKEWLDSNLPPLVERLVRAEIERVISRATV